MTEPKTTKVKKSKVRAPKGGYDFEEKRRYREHVWSKFAGIGHDDYMKVLFFPSKEGLEIPIALSKGFKQCNLIAVDEDYDVINNSKWHKEYPDIKTYCGKLSELIPIMEKDKLKFNFANLDFCYNLNQEIMHEFKVFVCSDLISDFCTISLTVMNGRESTATNTLANLLSENMYLGIGRNYSKDDFGFKNKRLSAVVGNSISELNNINRYLSFTEDEDYMSGNTKMSYGFMSIIDDEAAKEQVVCDVKTNDLAINRVKSLKSFWEQDNEFKTVTVGCPYARYFVVNYQIITKFAKHLLEFDEDDAEEYSYYGIPIPDFSVLKSIYNESFFKSLSGDFLGFVKKHGEEYNDLISKLIDDINIYEVISSKLFISPSRS